MLMKKALVQTLSLALLLGAGTTSFAATKKKAAEKPAENVVEVTPQQATPEELAAIQVLAEICPDLIGKKDAEFAQGYERLAKDFLPNETDAVEALKDRSKDRDFKKYMKEARKDAKAAGDEQNTLVCQDVKAYQSQH